MKFIFGLDVLFVQFDTHLGCIPPEILVHRDSLKDRQLTIYLASYETDHVCFVNPRNPPSPNHNFGVWLARENNIVDCSRIFKFRYRNEILFLVLALCYHGDTYISIQFVTNVIDFSDGGV